MINLHTHLLDAVRDAGQVCGTNRLHSFPQPPFEPVPVLLGLTERNSRIITPKSRLRTWFHPQQVCLDNQPTGHEILATLVPSYEIGKDMPGKTYIVHPDDPINNHWGLQDLHLLVKNWKSLSPEIKEWARDHLLYAWAGVARNEEGYLVVPYIAFKDCPPTVKWYSLATKWLYGEVGVLHTPQTDKR